MIWSMTGQTTGLDECLQINGFIGSLLSTVFMLQTRQRFFDPRESGFKFAQVLLQNTFSRVRVPRPRRTSLCVLATGTGACRAF